MKRLFVFLTVFGFGANTANLKAQGSDPLSDNMAINTSSYNNAIGLRAGGTSGVTFKHFFNSNNAMEGIVGIWPYGVSLTGLYERHENAGVEGLNWYYGGGAHVGVETNRIYYSYYDRRYYAYRGDDVGIGMDGIVGIEYKIKPIPFAFSFDLKPYFEVNTSGRAHIAIDPGLGIKVAF